MCPRWGDFPEVKFSKFHGSSNVNREAKRAIVTGQKVRVKLMLQDVMFQCQSQEIKNKIQCLSQNLAHELIVKQKIPIGTTWNGAWYVSRDEFKSNYPSLMTWGVQAPTPRTIQVYERYVQYDEVNKPLRSLSNQKAQQVEEQKEHVYIGCTLLRNVWTQHTANRIGLSLYNFMVGDKSRIRQTGKVEFNENMHRIKYWSWKAFYYFECTEDKTYLGDCFAKAMKVALGVRLQNGYQLIEPLQWLETTGIEAKVMNGPADMVAVNLYHNPTRRSVSSGIVQHNEADRYDDLVVFTFTSNPQVETVLSINQGELHGTAEVDIPSKDMDVVKFDS